MVSGSTTGQLRDLPALPLTTLPFRNHFGDMSGDHPTLPEGKSQHSVAAVISAVLNVVLAPILLGTCSLLLMGGLAFASSMAGPPITGIMLVGTLPPALLSAILARRTGVIPATLAGLIFSGPVLWACHESIQEAHQRHSQQAAEVWYQVGYLTFVFAIAASAFLAILARASREAKEANKAARD